ncbi:hypothetical protein POL68_28190 [Stigmatella sp. ncwal1]|uniref:ABC-transporter type IV n=1 Tax=Stigmatella ashevillensis TaxID=2995309 RepID=A0ABT5DFE0_9BACT|nr:hypothetical protein [Stigmatella ashevillena]MDC0712376.1 hypothetical protein [Stigmatella ashevillena]
MNGDRGALTEPLAPGGERLGVLGRFIVYGLMGLCIECCFTSVMDLATGEGDLRLKGYSYLWMHPIWGATLLLAEVLMGWLKRLRLRRFTRAFIAMAASFTIEYVTGALLVVAVGRCPWDYSASPWNVHGLIRLDYAPLWFLCGLTCEPLTRFVRRIRIFAWEPEALEAASGPNRSGEETLSRTSR